MPHDPRVLLEDIRVAAANVRQFTANETYERYLENVILLSAVERQFEIVAEALNRLLKLAPDLAQRITDYRRIINFRNLLNHAYERINHRVVWDTSQNDAPILIREVEELLASLGDE